MKSQSIALIVTLFISSLLLGCGSVERSNKWNGELPPLGKEYPELLPSERAHPVFVKLRACPSCLTKEDITEMARLISLVPGLPNYTIGLIETSFLWPDCFDVFLYPYIVILEKGKSWRVRKVIAYNAD
jgi:hypothetical protein